MHCCVTCCTSNGLLQVDVAADAWSLTANVTVTVPPCDFTTLTVDFGQAEPPALLYVQVGRDSVVSLLLLLALVWPPDAADRVLGPVCVYTAWIVS